MDSDIRRHSSSRHGVAMFVVLAVIVVVTMLGFMGITMARNDVVGTGDILDARSRDNAAYTGLSLALARMEVDASVASAQLSNFIRDSAEASPHAWFDFSSGGGSFSLASTKPGPYSTKGASGPDASVRVRVVSMDLGDNGGKPIDGIKITLQSFGVGRSGEEISTMATYRVLGLDIVKEKVVTNTGVPTHALYLGGNLQNASGNFQASGSVYVSGNYYGNSGGNTIQGKLKIGGDMNLPGGNPQTIDSNAWIGGSLTVNSGNRLHYKKNLGVGKGLCLMNDSLVVDSSLNIYGSCATPLDWQSERYIKVNGRQFLLRDQTFGTMSVTSSTCGKNVPYPPWWITYACNDTSISTVRKGPIFVKNGSAFFPTGLHSDASGAASDSFRYLYMGDGTTGDCGSAKSFIGRSVWTDSVYEHNACELSMSTIGAPPTLNVGKRARFGWVKNGTIKVAAAARAWAPVNTLIPAGASATGIWTYGMANDNVVPKRSPLGLRQLGMDSTDTVSAIDKNPPNTIKLTALMAPKFQKLSELRARAGVSGANMTEAGTGRYINKMFNFARDSGLLHNGYLLLWVDNAVNIKYNGPDDLINAKVLYIIDNTVYCSFNWPPSLDASAIQIIYLPKAQTVGTKTLSGNGGFASGEFGIQDGPFYGYFYAEKLLNLRTKFDVNFQGAIALTVAGSSMEMQATGKNADATRNNTLNVTLNSAVFTDINTNLGIIQDPAGSSAQPTYAITHGSGLVARQSKLQFIPVGEFR